MASNGADIHLILMRPTRVPVAGESVSHLFQGQVIIDSLRWNLHNQDEAKRAQARDEAYNKTKYLVERSGSALMRTRNAAEDFRRERDEANKALLKARAASDAPDAGMAEYTRSLESAFKSYNRSVDDVYGRERQRTVDELREEMRDEEIQEAERNRNFEITFTKRVDIASTQMLNSMKAGDIFPSATLTIHKRSTNPMEGTSLVFNIQKLRLTDYQLQVAVTDTMTEMVEEWTAEFGALGYTYKNPPAHYDSGNAAQAGVKAATQATVRVFAMKNIGSPI